MMLHWQYSLSANRVGEDYEYESPIYVKDDTLYFISSRPQMIHVIDKHTGSIIARLPCIGESVIPSRCFFQAYMDKLIVYTGELWVLENGVLLKLLDRDEEASLNSSVLFEHYFLCASRHFLYCCDLDTNKEIWRLNISNTKHYRGGNISIFEGKVACSGNDHLLFVDIQSGQIIDKIKIPRVDKLFMPIRDRDGSLLIGYTNWSNAGVLKYDLLTRKVIWRYKRNFEGPLLHCKIYTIEDKIYWCKNETELICVDSSNGEERFRFRTEPWLYSDLYFCGDRILFGTSGRDGFLYNIHADSGELCWSIPMKNGCAYFDFCNDTVCAGDMTGKVWQIQIEDGRIRQEYQMDAPIIGRVTVDQGCLYTVAWCRDATPIRLIKIEL